MPNPGQEFTIQKHCFVIAQNPGGPQDAVFCMEFGGQRPSSESVVESLLCQPGGEFPVAIEAESWTDMSDEVMDCSKSIVGTAEPTIDKRVTAIRFVGTRRDLEHTIFTYRSDHLVIGVVGPSTMGECNIYATLMRTILCQTSEKFIGASFELPIGQTNGRITMITSPSKECGSDLRRENRIHMGKR